MIRVVGAVLGVAALTALVLIVREATLSVHETVAPDSREEVVLEASTRDRPDSQTVAEMTRALLLGCRLEVESDVVEEHALGDGRFRFVLQPALDDSNRRQLRGCLEDMRVDHLLVDVEEMRALE